MVDQNPIRNTTADFRDNPMDVVMLGLGRGGSDALTEIVTAQESDGQRQVVNSDRLPTKGSEDPELLTLGFTFGEVDKRDDLFRPATLPSGWARQGSDHAMWSYIVDEHGRKRVGIFYKAAFYDRRANMYLETPTSYLRSALFDGTAPILDDVWLTPAMAAATLEALAKQSDEQAVAGECFAGRPDLNTEYWSGRAAEHRAEATKARALAASLVQS